MLSNIILAFIFGAVIGGVIQFYFIRKIWIRLQRKLPEVDVTRETINAIIKGEAPKGDIIRVNKVERILKESEGEITLDSILEDEEK